eukprot:Nk52_evm19s260 gene=Nk52_evmTU19s260
MSGRKRKTRDGEGETTFKPIPATNPVSGTFDPAPLLSQIELEEWRKKNPQPRVPKSKRPVRVYADGIFDMFHAGHARMFKQAKNLIPGCYLIVGVCSDALTHKMKGRTVMDEFERYEAVRHCRYVDEVRGDAPWEVTPEWLKENEIDYIAHDDLPYGTADAEDVYAAVKKAGMFKATARTEGVSTSDVIARIIKDYDVYVRRNLKRGYSRQDLNLSYTREKRVKLKGAIDEMKQKVGSEVQKIQKKGEEFLEKWEDKSKDMMKEFLGMFAGRDLTLKAVLERTSSRLKDSISPNPLGRQRLESDDHESSEEYEESGTPSTEISTVESA